MTTPTTKTLWALALVVALGLGCKDAPAPSATGAEPTPAANTPPPEPAEPTEPAAPTEPAEKPAENAPGPSAEEAELTKKAAAVEETLRKYFNFLAGHKLDEARAMMMLDRKTCLTVFADTGNCESIVQAQEEALERHREDPVPFNAKILTVQPGSPQVLDKERGGVTDTPIWIGCTIHGRGPDGHEFLMRSLGVIETPNGHRVLWGKRRALKDTRRTLPPPAADAAPSAGGAPAPPKAP